MRISALIPVFTLCGMMLPALSLADIPPAPQAADAPPVVINISKRSVPGWFPSEDQRAQSMAAAQAYFDLLDQRAYDKAHDRLTPHTQKIIPEDFFIKAHKQEADMLGALKERKFLKTTWTKLPDTLPNPGIYAAIDISSLYEKADRHCGYVVMFQATAEEPFTVLRDEKNIIPNDVAAKQPPEKLAATWQFLSQNCF